MTGIAIPVLPQTDETSKWTPKIGKRTRSFIDSLAPSAFPSKTKKTLLDETYRILSSCHDPNDQGRNPTIGLVVGKVQSGKTTSFKTLSMMVMDNNFDLIILLAGRTNNLINQNKDEFIKLRKSIPEKFNIGCVKNQKNGKV